MKQAIILFFVLLIPFRGTGQNEANEDGVKLEKRKWKKQIIFPKFMERFVQNMNINREINASSISEVRNARFSLTRKMFTHLSLTKQK